jgi:hypothetical protein
MPYELSTIPDTIFLQIVREYLSNGRNNLKDLCSTSREMKDRCNSNRTAIQKIRDEIFFPKLALMVPKWTRDELALQIESCIDKSALRDVQDLYEDIYEDGYYSSSYECLKVILNHCTTKLQYNDEVFEGEPILSTASEYAILYAQAQGVEFVVNRLDTDMFVRHQSDPITTRYPNVTERLAIYGILRNGDLSILPNSTNEVRNWKFVAPVLIEWAIKNPHDEDINDYMKIPIDVLHRFPGAFKPNANWVMMAIEYKNRSALELLLRYHYGCHLSDEQGDNPCLKSAVEQGDMELVEPFFRYGVITQLQKNWAMAHAVHGGAITPMVQFLLSKGANPLLLDFHRRERWMNGTWRPEN